MAIADEKIALQLCKKISPYQLSFSLSLSVSLYLSAMTWMTSCFHSASSVAGPMHSGPAMCSMPSQMRDRSRRLKM